MYSCGNLRFSYACGKFHQHMFLASQKICNSEVDCLFLTWVIVLKWKVLVDDL